MAQKQTVSVERLRPALAEALERLMKKDEARRGFVIVDHEPTGRYLQFCTELETGKLLFDVGGFTGSARPPPYVMKPMPTMRSAVLTTEMIVRSANGPGWGLTSEDEVTITEDDTEGGGRRVLRKTKEWLAGLLSVPEPAEAT
jgi:hypothetical protein